MGTGAQNSFPRTVKEGAHSEMKIFSCGATLYALLCVCLFIYLFICPPFLIWDISLFEYLEYSRIFKERERNIKKLRTDKQITNTQVAEIKDTSYTYKGQLSTDKDDRK